LRLGVHRLPSRSLLVSYRSSRFFWWSFLLAVWGPGGGGGGAGGVRPLLFLDGIDSDLCFCCLGSVKDVPALFCGERFFGNLLGSLF